MQLGTSAQSLDRLAIEVATPEPAAITVLNSDLLWYIFCMNANLDGTSAPTVQWPHSRDDPVFKQSALTVTRQTSQVCRSWRRLILHSPNIWGNLIDVSSLYIGNDDWRDEVMKRTGAAVLIMRGFITSEAMMVFLVSLLNNHWWRVRILDILILDSVTPNIQSGSLDVVQTAAPNLETFNLTFWQLNRCNMSKTSLTFTSEAPMLREFGCCFIRIDPNSPWLPHLRHITLPPTSDVSQLLETLGHTKVLESLTYDSSNPFSTDSSTPAYPINPKRFTTLLRPLSLPQLRAITLRAPHRASVDFLQQITPSPDCALDWQLVEGIDEEELDATYSILSRYWLGFFSHHKVTGIAFKLKLNFADPMKTFMFIGTCQLGHPKFSFLVKRIQTLPPQFMSKLFVLVSSCKLSSITSLEMDGPLHDIIAKRDQAFLQFILSLSSLNVLIVSPCGVLDLLPQLPTDAWNILPSLNTLKVIPGPTVMIRWEIDRLAIFLTWRKAMGRVPIDMLDMTAFNMIEMGRKFWSSLDNITGLKLVWRDWNNIEEYICGSGAPSTLKFTRR